ncbi:SUMF1/EgtB/PvdO family nonheme iron enzyme [Caulobacter segnis]
MVRIDGRTFNMGSARFYPEEAPVRPVRVDSFWIDATPVTNRQFAVFVRATGHVTDAEAAPIRATIPACLPKWPRPAPGLPAAEGAWSRWTRPCPGGPSRSGPTGAAPMARGVRP